MMSTVWCPRSVLQSRGGLHHRPHNTISSRCSWVQSWRLLMLWLCLYGLPQGATATEPCGHLLAANCILCPDATVAAQHLTGNSAQLPISNAAFSGSCDSAYNSKGYILITNMSGHELAPLMPLGALLLATGDAQTGALTNNTGEKVSLAQPLGVPGTDDDLKVTSTLSGYDQVLYDQVMLQFDITPTQSGNLAFQYVFGSEEYPENTPALDPRVTTNDIFGFFIWTGSGPGTNVALLPNTTTPVSIATINNMTNSQYYIANSAGDLPKKSEFEGFTTLLKTKDYYVTAGTTYHIKLGIADGYDSLYDSIVWVKAGSVRFNIRDCAGSYLPDGRCTGHCEGGPGVLPEVFVYTTMAQNGGNPCAIANGTTRATTPCENHNPCPINCTASWVPVPGTCTGLCNGGTGFTQETWLVTSEALYEGYCAHANGSMRASMTSCTNNDPCPPVDCVGSWVPDGVCSGACGGGPGLLPEKYEISVTAAHGGNNCSSNQNDTRNSTTCTNSNPCPVDCVGSWVEQGNTCNGTCGFGVGYSRERYTITTIAEHGGAGCPEVDGALRHTLPCNNSDPCPVNCTYEWVPDGNCTGACNNGSGQLPERLLVTSAAQHGGYCPGNNGTTTRTVTPCINPTPCPPENCTGSWSSTRNCNGTCGGGSGTGLQDYRITRPPRYGGADCPYAQDTIREVPCTNNDCCPRNCIGYWNISGPCDAMCHNGTGFIPETFYHSVTMDCWGIDCDDPHGTVRRVIPCTNPTPCPPQHCEGGWVPNGTCNGTCGGGPGILPEWYRITRPANYSGNECPETHGATQAITPCNNTTPCPIDCVGNWVTLWGQCTGACNGHDGFVPEIFNVTVKDAFGGKTCDFINGTYRYVINCTNNNPCPPQNCVGQWNVISNVCVGGCGGRWGLKGLRRHVYTISIPAAYGGSNCSYAAGDTKLQDECENSAACQNIPCNGTWVSNGVCNGTCGNGGGMLPQRYHIYTNARDYGAACPFANNTLRHNQSCINTTPCPVNCSYTWQANGPCTGMCNNGSGLLPELFVITAAAQHNGSCPFTNGTTRLETACNTYTPCPVNCVGTWVPSGNCTGACAGGSGLLPETFVVQTPAQHGGTNCSYADGDTRLSTPCINTKPCPVHCQGHWETDGECNGPCNNGTGTLPERYNITQPALHEGNDCEAAHGDTRSTVACKNPEPCPINCAGTFVLVENGPCSGACGGGIGTRPEVFVINVPAQYGGIGCFIANGTLRHTATCVNSAACIPVDCVGGFSAFGPCSALCGGNTGFVPEKFIVSIPAVYGGKLCDFVSGATRYSTACTNNTVCPYGDVKVVISPPVLPPLNMSDFNDTDIVIKGGNVTITGMRVEGVSGSGSGSSTSGSSSFTPDSIGGGNSSTDIDAATGKPLKPRLAAFNGSLGFQTLGVLIEVLGEFELQRTMNWTWDEKWPAWITEVIIKGRFLLTREEIVNDVTVGVETMEPRVAGYLTLYSAIYPGPGFSGTYDWAGELEMSPDPFQKWADAADFFLQNGTNRTSPAPSHKRFRALLESESSTGTVPVQGRVSVREAKEAVTGVGSGAAYLDDTGDVMVVGPGPGPESNPNYIPVTKPGNIYTEDESALGGTNPKLVTIILAAVLAPAGVAMCASGVIAGILWKRRTRKEEQMEKADKTGRLARLHKHPDGGVAGRQQQKGSPGNEASPDGTLSEAQLELSSPGSRRDSPEEDEADDDPAGASRTRIQRLAPGETGFGSMPGGFDAMVTLPPRRDSVDWTMLQVEASRGSATARNAGMAWRISINGMRNSFTGIANGFAAALRIRMSQSGGAYAVPNTAAAQAENEVQVSGGSTLLWTNPVFTGSNFRADAALGRRVPTLPGGSSTAASPLSRGTSLDMAEFVAGASTSPKSPKSGPQHTHLRPPSASGAAKRAAAKPAGKKGL